MLEMEPALIRRNGPEGVSTPIPMPLLELEMNPNQTTQHRAMTEVTGYNATIDETKCCTRAM